MTDFNPGDVARVDTSPGFKNSAGTLTDPTAVKVRWKAPSGAVTTWTYLTDSQVVKDSVGMYHADIPITLAGTHYYGWLGTGAVGAAEEGTFLAVSAFDALP